MGGFDTLALGSKILFGDNWFSDFNAALHERSIVKYYHHMWSDPSLEDTDEDGCYRNDKVRR